MQMLGKFALMVAAILGGTSATSRPARQVPDQALKTANDAEVEAFLKDDPITLAHLWSDDFLVTNPLNQVANKSQVLDMVKGGMLSFKTYERRIEYIRHYGPLAAVIGSETVEWTSRMPLAGQPRKLRFTALWKRSGGRWTEVVRHANIVPDPPKP
jgi:hypothetical protein